MAIILPGAAELQALSAPPEPGIAVPDGCGDKGVFDTVARAGFRAVALSSRRGELGDPERLAGLGMKRLREAVRGAGLEFTTLNDGLELGCRGRAALLESRARLRALAEAANHLECPVVTVLCAPLAGAGGADAARCALEALHDVESELHAAGVRVALGARGGVTALWTDSAARTLLLSDKPESVGLALADDLNTDSGTLHRLAHSALAAEVHLDKKPLQDVRFDHETAARDLVAALRESKYHGRLTAVAGKTLFDRETLGRLYERLIALAVSR